MISRQYKRVLVFLTTALLCVIACTPVFAASIDKLDMTLNSIEEADGGKNFSFSYNNATGHQISFGWVSSCECIVQTDAGTFATTIHSVSNVLSSGNGEFSISVNPCPGTVQQITFTHMLVLDDRGLPTPSDSGTNLEFVVENAAALMPQTTPGTESVSQDVETPQQSSGAVAAQKHRAPISQFAWFLIFAICVNILMGALVAWDANRAGLSPLWFLAVLVGNGLGLIIYLCVRSSATSNKKTTAAPKTQAYTQPTQSYCSMCGQPLQAAWKACPYCGAAKR